MSGRNHRWARIWKSKTALRPAMRRALVGTILLAICLLLLCAVAEPLVGKDVVLTFLISTTAVVGFGIFVGNSGILSFGHAAFMAVAAYGSALMTMQAIDKELLLPELPGWLVDLTLPFGLAFACALVLVGVVAVVSGVVIARLPGYSAAIASLGVLIITYVALLGADQFTNGASTFYGAPFATTIPIAFAVAAGAIAVARVFRESRVGLQLRASREDEIGARAMGVNIARVRGLAWVIGAVVAGAAGVLQAHYLGAFSPKEFYFGATFTFLAMLIVGGSASVTGAVAGTALMTALIEILRRFESGASLGPVSIPAVVGLTQIGISLALIAVMYFRRGGLFGNREVDELLLGVGGRLRARLTGADHQDEEVGSAAAEVSIAQEKAQENG